MSQPGGGTRLLVRSTVSNPRIPAWAAALNLAAFQLPHFIMQRGMLLGIKNRAEASAAAIEDFARVERPTRSR